MPVTLTRNGHVGIPETAILTAQSNQARSYLGTQNTSREPNASGAPTFKEATHSTRIALGQ
jgi:hypothetical protein